MNQIIKIVDGTKYISVPANGISWTVCESCVGFDLDIGEYSNLCGKLRTGFDDSGYCPGIVWKTVDSNTQMYSAHQILEACTAVGIGGIDASILIDMLDQTMIKCADPDYQKYLELKARYESSGEQ